MLRKHNFTRHMYTYLCFWRFLELELLELRLASLIINIFCSASSMSNSLFTLLINLTLFVLYPGRLNTQIVTAKMSLNLLK